VHGPAFQSGNQQNRLDPGPRFGSETPDRIDLLFKLAQQAGERAKNTDGAAKYLSIMNNNGLSMALNAIEGFVKPESRSFVTGTMLAGYIGQERV
jgi:hypothetical protein